MVNIECCLYLGIQDYCTDWRSNEVKNERQVGSIKHEIII
jgi:hypothetical protein